MSIGAGSDADDLYRRASAACQRGAIADGLDLVRQAILIDARQARFHKLLGMALAHLGRHEEALASFDCAIALSPDSADTHGNRADALVALGRPADALASFERALALNPASIEDWCNYGATLVDLHRHEEAIAKFDRALTLARHSLPAHYNRGNALANLGRLEEAIASYDAALAIDPNSGDILNNRGNVLRRIGHPERALADFDRALASIGERADILCNRALALESLRRYDEALAVSERAALLDPNRAAAHYIRSQLLFKHGRIAETIPGYERAADLGHPSAVGMLALCCRMTCDWPKAERAEQRMNEQIRTGEPILAPFVLVACGVAPTLQLRAIKNFVRHEIGTATPPRAAAHRRHDKIRVAYLSADFNPHPVSYLAAGLFERHDRSRFDVIGVSFGPADTSDIRARVVKAFDQFHDVGAKTDKDIITMLNALEIDIAVDLTGFTENGRPGVLAGRAAPIQVTFLGYSATTAADFMDYVIADRIVLPFDQQPHYSEKIVHLPDSFMVTDTTQRVSAHATARSDVGLPEQGFVFCSFNECYKITAPVFDIWMRLLQQVEDSVLWLMRPNDTAAANLRREAEQRGINPARIVFAPKLPLADHLARIRHADLFLDTQPVNAGATAVDALRVGLPVLTCPGQNFVSRVAASLLHAAGLPELVASHAEDYQSLARRLATDPQLLRSIRGKLERTRSTCPLFDTDRFRRHIESAFSTMQAIHHRGEAPRSFSVDPID